MARALGLRKFQQRHHLPWVVDATAGLGRDSWLLASLGCRVTAIERSPVVAELLREALRCAAVSDAKIAERIAVTCADATSWLGRQPRASDRPDVVYLDPMFPSNRKGTLQKRRVRFLRRLVGPDEDGSGLIQAALAAAQSRVVVKRPIHGQLRYPGPVATHRGKSVRYDVYVPSTRTGGGDFD